MAVATDSTPAPARRLLRAAGPCRVLTTADVLALVAEPDARSADNLLAEIDREIGRQEALTRHARPRFQARVRRSPVAQPRVRLRA